MASERMKILNLLSAGKISAAEASQLLQSIAQGETADLPPISAAETTQEKESGQEEPDLTSASQTGELRVVKKATSSDVEEVEIISTEDKPESGLWHWIRHLIASVGPREKYEEELEWSMDGAAISEIMAHTTNGSVKFRGMQESQITVHAHKVVKAATIETAESFAEQVAINLTPTDGKLQIYKDHPKPPPGVEVTVSYRIEAPRQMNLTLQTTNGKVKAQGVEGHLQATTTNGKVSLSEVSGQIQAKTTNGSIAVEADAIQQESLFSTTNGSINVKVQAGSAPLAAKTLNGSVTLTLPADFSGQLDAKTVNGSVKTDFPLAVTGKKRNHMTGQIGDGGDANVELRTINGSIRLAVQTSEPVSEMV